jgi:iron complex outermembrane receptor protein
MTMGRGTWCVVALLAALGVASAHAQTGSIAGRVTETGGAPIPGAEVRVDSTSIHASTDGDGRYTLRDVTVGPHVVRALMLGYKALTRAVTVADGTTATADFVLEETVLPSPGVEVVVGSRAKHTAADELAVPVDVFNHDVLVKQGTTETSQALQALSPSVNFPRQTVTDATDVVRPFTLRGLSPDHTLVLVNGMRRHPTAVVNTFAYGTAAGSSGVDMNAIPSSAIERIEVLRDGASAQYGSDAIAGVVNVVMRRGVTPPFVNVTGGQSMSPDYPYDGGNINVNGGWGLPLGQGSLNLSGEYLDRQPTNRAWADSLDTSGSGLNDHVGPDGKVVQKRNPVEQPNQHWGDGLERDVLGTAFAHYPLGPRSHLYGFGSYGHRLGTGDGYRRYADDDRNWTQIYPLGYLPEFRPIVTDYSTAGGWRGDVGGWNVDAGATFGHNGFRYDLDHTLNASLGPSLTTPTAPGPDGVLGTADDPGIPNQTSFFAGELHRDEFVASLDGDRELKLGLPYGVHTAFGAAWRRERWVTLAGERASWIDGGATSQNGNDTPGGSQVFPGFAPSDASDSRRENTGVYADLETNLTNQLLVNGAARYEHYSDFGSVTTGKLAARYQPTSFLTFRAAGSTGFRAPGLGQIHFSKVVTNFIAGAPEEIGIFPVDHPAAKALGAEPLKPEKSVNLSAGFAVTVLENLTVTLDAYDIRIRDRILLGATFDDSTSLRILGNAGFTGIAGVQYFTNGLDTKTQGVDATADWRMLATRTRSFTLQGALNWGKNEITHVDPLPSVLSTSTDEKGLLDEVTRVAIEKERPDWRGTLTGEYTQGLWRGLARVSYYGTFSSAQPAFTDGYTEHYPARALVDLEGAYKLMQVEFAVGARNVFDAYPGRAQLDYNNNFGTFPWAAASPFGYNGRFLYTRASWTLPSK